jgi:UDP-3-O-[3-hydroxymyristoyl] glucosamine N-acyltransferase
MLLSELAVAIGAELEGEASIEVGACASLESAEAGQVSFLANQRYASQLATTKASAVIVGAEVRRPESGVALLRAKDPYFAFRNAVIALHGFRRHPHSGIHPLAFVDPTASIGRGTVIYPFAYVGAGAKIGADCILYPNVTVYDGCVLGDRVTLHAGCSVGNDGFGYATHALPGEAPAHHKIPQSGNAVLEDDVELGANCSIDRATIGSTVIGRGTKFSNNVVIGHGTKVGVHNLFVAQVGLAGSVTTGAYVLMGGQSGAAGHLKIGNQVRVAGQSGIMHDVEDKQVMMGTPAIPSVVARRVYNHFQNLDALVKRLKELEKKVAELEGS